MTQILVTLDNEADVSLLLRMIENMKGVIHTKISRVKAEKELEKSDKWFEKLENMRNNFDASYIDMDDERTRYILSK